MKDITREILVAALEKSHASSLTQLHHALGGKGSVSGSTGKKFKSLVPEIGDLLAKNKGSATAMVRADKKTARAASSKKYPRSRKNPFREGSSYAVVFDVLAAHPNGLHREKLVAECARLTRKDIKHSSYDCSVLLSASDSVNGPRHRSCQNGFWCQKTNSHVVLRTE